MLWLKHLPTFIKHYCLLGGPWPQYPRIFFPKILLTKLFLKQQTNAAQKIVSCSTLPFESQRWTFVTLWIPVGLQANMSHLSKNGNLQLVYFFSKIVLCFGWCGSIGLCHCSCVEIQWPTLLLAMLLLFLSRKLVSYPILWINTFHYF